MANEISLDITENVTKIETTENVTTVEISPEVTTVELRGISIAQAVNASAIGYGVATNPFENTSATVQSALDTINTNALNKNINQTIASPVTTLEYGSAINFTAGSPVYNAMNLGNNNIIGVNHITFNDAGPNEGLIWSNTKIFESPNDLSTNTAGNFQVTYSGNRKLTVDSSGIDVAGSITSSEDIITSKNITSNAVVEKLTKSGSVTLSKGDVVYLAGYANDSALVDKAIASDSSKMPAYGIVSSVSGNNVDVAVSGSVDFLPFSNLSSGQKLYVSADTAGALTTTAPAGQTNIIQNIANIEHTRASSFSTISEPAQVTDTQHVYISNVTKSADSSEVSITVSYKSDDATTTGIGFLVNFDANILTSPVVSNLYSTGNASAGVVSGSTINFAWSSISSDWPGTGAVNLATITFTLSNNAVGDPTTLSFTPVSNTSGKTAAYQSQVINGVYKSQDFVGTVKLNTLARSSDTPNLNTGNILLGVNNVATPTSFDTTFGTSFVTRSVGGLSDVDITTTTPTNNQVLVWSTDKFVPADQAGSQTITFASITSKPTTISGYGITDALELGTTSTTALAGNTSLLELGTSSTTALAGDTALLQLGTSSTTALAGDTTFAFAEITSKPTTISGYGITDAFDGATSSLSGNIDLASQVTGTLPVSNMAATALTTVQTAESESAQLALTTEEGDVVVRSDENKTYMHNGGSAGTMADFTLLATPTDAVTSVDGNTGVITTLQIGTTAGTALEGNTTIADLGGQASLTFGIADTNAVKVDHDGVADDDYAKFTANGIEGRSAAEVKTDLSLNNVENTAVSTFAGTSNITTVGTVTTGTWQGTAIADAYISSASTWNGKQDPLIFGIADTNAVKVDHDGVADDDYAKFTANGIEGRSAAEVKTDLSLNNVENTAVSTFAGSANITTVGTVTTGTWQGTAIADAYISSASTWNGKQDPLIFGIADTNAVKVDGSATDGEYVRFNANGIESRTDAQVLSDIGAQAVLSEGAFANGDKTKLNSVELNNPEFDSVILDNSIVGGDNWTIQVDASGSLVFKYGATAKMKLTLSGELVVDDDITAFGSV